ncbi:MULTISPECIES: histidine kinase [unclassified Actinopolyspora]|uniref:sensor histidine kinase n=1 Tax=unclassified Actinopolyspora TaxID=2639451 RepID=UPI0013F61120|nr:MULTISPECIES: histidine kinase [unclassified Actinopolyspora]NHD19440.1 sensor histidine kinase [Actinopolyspora sp. BKK2]NHE78487.1 sensor histidine kinase [Actinopolyspora sp. BKK1]
MTTDARSARTPRFMDHYSSTWWIAELLSTLLLAWPLFTVLRQGPPLWISAALVTSMGCWVAFLGAERYSPRSATTALAVCSVLSSATVGTAQGTAIIIAAVSVGILASHPTPGARLIAGVCALDMTLVSASVLTSETSPIVLLSAIPVMLVLILLGLSRRQYQIHAQRTAQLLEELRQAQQARTRAAALDERARIAREMHDVLAHSLGGLGMQLEVAEALLNEQKDPETALQHVRRSRRLAADGLAEARNAVAALRRDIPSLPAALDELADNHRRDQHTDVSVHTTGTGRSLPSGVTVSLLDTAREALTNAAKHAPTAAIAITLDYGESSIRLRVHNAGVPEAANSPAPLDDDPDDNRSHRAEGFGLTGMRERLALVDGRLTAGPDGAGGWSVTADVPVTEGSHR